MIGRVLSPFIVGMGARVAGQIIAFATVVAAGRFLDLETFGVYAIAWALTVIATTFVYNGYYHALLRSTRFAEEVDTLFWLTAGVGLVGSLLLLLCGLVIGPAGETGRAILILAPLPFIAALPAWNEAQLVHAGRARAASLYVLVAEAAGFIALLAGFQAGYGLMALLISRYVVAGTGLIGSTALVRALPRLVFRRATLRPSSRTALPLWGTTAIGMFSNYGADLVLAAFLNPAAVGAYRSGSRIAMTASDIVLQPLRLLSWSKFSRLEKSGDRPAIRAAWRENMAMSTAILWPCMATVALLSTELVLTIFGESWLPAAAIITILSVSRGVAVLVALLEPTLICLGKTTLPMKLRILSGTLLFAFLLAIGRFGAEWSALANLMAMSVMAVVTAIVLSRALELGARDMARTFLPAAGATLLVVAVIQLWGLWGPTLGATQDLLAVLALVLAVWGGAMAVYLATRVLRVPTP